MNGEQEDHGIHFHALLTGGEPTGIRLALAQAWPLDESPDFTALLQAMDDADRATAGR